MFADRSESTCTVLFSVGFNVLKTACKSGGRFVRRRRAILELFLLGIFVTSVPHHLLLLRKLSVSTACHHQYAHSIVRFSFTWMNVFFRSATREREFKEPNLQNLIAHICLNMYLLNISRNWLQKLSNVLPIHYEDEQKPGEMHWLKYTFMWIVPRRRV